MVKPKKVNILGTEYKIIYQTKEENESLLECRGYVEFYTKDKLPPNETILFFRRIKKL